MECIVTSEMDSLSDHSLVVARTDVAMAGPPPALKVVRWGRDQEAWEEALQPWAQVGGSMAARVRRLWWNTLAVHRDRRVAAAVSDIVEWLTEVVLGTAGHHGGLVSVSESGGRGPVSRTSPLQGAWKELQAAHRKERKGPFYRHFKYPPNFENAIILSLHVLSNIRFNVYRLSYEPSKTKCCLRLIVAFTAIVFVSNNYLFKNKHYVCP